MNQILKDKVYNLGSKKHVDFMIKVGGMNDEEAQMFRLLHDGKSDTYILDAMSLSRKGYDRIYESVRAKLTLAIFECVNHYMDVYDE